jgi:ribosomal protein S18 acetylase RimI-like enzyme
MIPISEHIHLIKITINDQNKLMDLAWKIYPPEYKYLWENEDCNWYLNRCYGLKNFNEELSENDAHYYFVIYKSEIEGFIRFVFNKPLEQFPGKSATYLHRIYLSQESQGTGVSQKLIHWIEQKSKEKGMDYMWLEAMCSKDRALQFYKKNSFEILTKKRLSFDLILDHLREIYLMYKPI